MKGFIHCNAPKFNCFDFNGKGDCVLRCLWNSDATALIKRIAKVSKLDDFIDYTFSQFDPSVVTGYRFEN